MWLCVHGVFAIKKGFSRDWDQSAEHIPISRLSQGSSRRLVTKKTLNSVDWDFDWDSSPKIHVLLFGWKDVV